MYVVIGIVDFVARRAVAIVVDDVVRRAFTGVDVDHGECDCDECDECDDSPDRDASDLAFFRQVTPRKRGRCGVDSHASECVRGCGVGAAEAVAAAIVALRRVELEADDDIKDNVSPDRGKKNMVRKNGNSDKRGSILHDIGTCDRLEYRASACLGGFGGVIPRCDDVSHWEIFCGEEFDGKFSCGHLRCDCRCCSGKLWINFATPFREASPADGFYHSRDPAPASSTRATVSDDGGNDDGDSTSLGIVRICRIESFGSSLSLDL
jgi:hypothetical protein